MQKYEIQLNKLENLNPHDYELLSILDDIKFELHADSSSNSQNKSSENPESFSIPNEKVNRSSSNTNYIGMSVYYWFAHL